MTRFEEFILRTLVIVLVPVVAGLAFYVKVLWMESRELNPYSNPYVSPQNVYGVVDYVKELTVTIRCGSSVGSGFSFRPTDKDKTEVWKFDISESTGSVLLTNYHVVENCLENSIDAIVKLAKGKEVVADILAIDKANDIAVLSIKPSMDYLEPLWWEIYNGYWVMATGSPFDMQGTVTFGNIINIEENKIFTSASLNRGNSGGPLTDNEGYVIGINTGYRAVAQNVNWAVDINALCEELVDCSGPEFEDGLIHRRG
jgi:S1-C subfamily serine protease